MGIVLPEGIFNNPSLAYVREFCENRAYIRAVVSLPQETFFSIGASVKASLLFMQRFTEEEKADFEKKREAAEAETHTKYLVEIEKEAARLQSEIGTAKQTRDAQRLKEIRDQLLQFQREMEARIQVESRALLKERFPYPIFLYEAEKVGITATGEGDQNELYPNLNQPLGKEAKTCLELYHEFRKDPKRFLE